MIATLMGIFGTTFLAVFAWTIQLGNRVSVIEAEKTDLEKLINAQFDEVNRRLDRIERAMNGSIRRNA